MFGKSETNRWNIASAFLAILRWARILLQKETKPDKREAESFSGNRHPDTPDVAIAEVESRQGRRRGSRIPTGIISPL